MRIFARTPEWGRKKGKMTDTSIVSKDAPAKAVSQRRAIESVHCYSHGIGIYYLWLFLVPALMGLLVHFGIVGGRAAVWTVIFTYWAVGNVAFDLSRTAAVALAAIVAAILMAMLVAEMKWNIPLFDWIGGQLAAIPLGWTPEVQGLIYGLAGVFFFLWAYEIMDSLADGKWVFSRNEFIHMQWGRRDNSLARGQCTVAISTPDRFKWLLGFGGARIEIHAAEDNNRVHAVLENVIMGSRKGRRIHELLQATQVVKIER